MAIWDVFHSDRLEVERGLDDEAVRLAFAQGKLTDLDLIRVAGSGSPWEPLIDRIDDLNEATIVAPPPPVPAPTPPSAPADEPTVVKPERRYDNPPDVSPFDRTELDTAMSARLERVVKDDEDDEADVVDDPDPDAVDDEIRDDALEILDEPDFEKVDSESSAPILIAFADETQVAPGESPPILDPTDRATDATPPEGYVRPHARGPILPPLDSAVAIPVPGPAPLPWAEQEFEVDFDDSPDPDPEAEYDPLEEDEAVAEFTLARGSTETVEELDLAAMVDVAFQLVLFFLVTATTVLYKSLEVPRPNNDAPPEAAAQGRSKSLDDLKADYILVEIDSAGTLKIDRQPVPGDLTMTGLADRLRTLRADTGRTAMLLSADFTTPHRNAVLAYDAANEIGLRIAIAKPKDPGTAPPPPIKRG